MKSTTSMIALACAFTLGLGACSSTPVKQESGVLKVVTSIYPIDFIASEIGGATIQIQNMTPPGVEPHDLELTPSQIIALDKADLLIYFSGFQPSLEKAAELSPPKNIMNVLTLKKIKLIDLAAGSHNHTEETASTPGEGLSDPHIWLDPQRLSFLVNEVAAKFKALDPSNANSYETNRISLTKRLNELDKNFIGGLKTCERRLIVTSHAAFGYLADAYGLEQEAISGLSPESEPTPKRLNEIRKEAMADGTTTIFFETLASPKVAQTLADDLNISAAVLDPLEGVRKGQTYFSVMEQNLGALRKALSCRP